MRLFKFVFKSVVLNFFLKSFILIFVFNYSQALVSNQKPFQDNLFPSMKVQKFKEVVKTHTLMPKSYFLCKTKDEARTIRLINKTEGGCYINYTKQGVDEKVGESKSQETCNTVLDNIKSNLESATWKCKNISSSMITEPKIIVQ